jgi:long-chain acyl-CoA synthetase
MRFEHHLTEAARVFPNKRAIATRERSITYRELRDEARSFARALRQAGVERGDRVVIYLDNSVELIVAAFGSWYADAVFSIVNATTKADKLKFILDNCRAAAVVTDEKLLAQAKPAIDDAASVKTTFVVGQTEDAGSLRSYDAALKLSPEPLPPLGISFDLAMIIYTSGSTGFPKGVMMTHDNVQAAASSVSTYLELQDSDIVLSVLPLSFDYGLYQVLMSVMKQATLLVEKSFAFPAPVLRRLREENVTGFPLVPTIAAMLVQMKDLSPQDLASVRFITNTAAALPKEHIFKLIELFPNAKVFSMYGMTESKRCTYLPPEELKNRPTSVGKAIPNTEVYLVDEDGNRLPNGSTGELVVRGSHVMQGYWENPEATAKRLKPGPHPWEQVLHTGDIFRSDEDGFLYFVSRMDDIIKSRGEKVSPKEVEAAIYSLEGVSEVAVIGVPDEVFGSAIKAFVVPVPGATLTAQQVLKHAASKLENFMVPKYVEFRESLPKTSTGKVSKKMLAEGEA